MSRIGIVNYSRNWKNHIPSPRLWLPENLLFKLWCKLCHGFWKLSNGYYSWCQMWSVVLLVVRRGSRRCRLFLLAYSQVHVSCWPYLRIVLVTPVMKTAGTAPEVSPILVPVQAIVCGVGALPFRAALAIYCATQPPTQLLWLLLMGLGLASCNQGNSNAQHQCQQQKPHDCAWRRKICALI